MNPMANDNKIDLFFIGLKLWLKEKLNKFAKFMDKNEWER